MEPDQRWAVQLVDAGPRLIPVITAIREALRCDLRLAKELAENGGVVATGLTADEADRVLARLESAGGTARRVESTDAVTVGPAPPRSVESDDGAYDKLRERVKSAIAQNVRADERVRVVVRGARGQAIVGTASRCFVCKPGFMAGAAFGAEVSSWSYRNIVGIQIHKGLMTGAVIIQAPGQAGLSTSYWRDKDSDPFKAPNAIPIGTDWREVTDAVARLRELIDAAHTEPPPQAASAVAAPASLAEELQKLAELHQSGVLNDAEFSAAKQRVLESS